MHEPRFYLKFGGQVVVLAAFVSSGGDAVEEVPSCGLSSKSHRKRSAAIMRA